MRTTASPIALIVELFAGHNFLTFRRLQDETGLSYSELIALKPVLQDTLHADITSRVDLADPGLFLEG